MDPYSQLYIFVRSSGRTKAHQGTVKGAEYCFMERTKRARMAFLVYLATEVKGTLNTPFPLISHTDFSYTRNFVLQEYSWKTFYFFHDKTNEAMIVCSWFKNIVIHRLTCLCTRRCFETIQWDRLAVVCLIAFSEQLLSNLVLCRLLLYRVFSLSQVFQFAQILTNAVSFLPSVI